MKSILNYILNKKIFYAFLILVGCVLLSACEFKDSYNAEKVADEMRSIRGCWSCQAFRTVYDAVGSVAKSAYENMRVIALNLLAIFLALWLLFKTLSFITIMNIPNYSKYWVDVARRIMRAVFAGAILINTPVMIKFINFIVEPVFLLFIYLSMQIVNANDNAFAVGALMDVGSQFQTDTPFPAGVGNQLENLIYRIQVALDIGRSLGLRMIILSDFSGIFIGFFILIMFISLSIFFPYYFIDSLIRLGFVIILFPLFVVAWVFPKTVIMSLLAWKIFFAGLVQILIGCIFAALSVSIIEAYSQLRGYNLLLNPIYQDASTETIREMTRMSVSSISFLVVCFYISFLAMRTKKIAGFLTDLPATSVLIGMMEKVKSIMKALLYAAIATVATYFRILPIATVMKKRAWKEAKNAIIKNNG